MEKAQNVSDVQLVECIKKIEDCVLPFPSSDATFQRKQAFLKLQEARLWLESSTEYQLLNFIQKK